MIKESQELAKANYLWKQSPTHPNPPTKPPCAIGQVPELSITSPLAFCIPELLYSQSPELRLGPIDWLPVLEMKFPFTTLHVVPVILSEVATVKGPSTSNATPSPTLVS